VSAQWPQLMASAGFDYAALAAELQAVDLHAASHILVNETLCDVRSWRHDDRATIVARLSGDPLAAVAALELTSAAKRIREVTPSESEFLRPFARADFLKHLLFFATDDAPLELPRTHILLRETPADGILFLHSVIRWAQRFAHWKGGRRELAQLCITHPFAKALLPPSPEPQEALIYGALRLLGIEAIERDPAIATHHFPTWLMQRLGLSASVTKAKQQHLDFRQAGGTHNSLYVVRAIGGVDGVDVRGSAGEDVALIVDLGDREVTMATTAFLEQHFLRVINECTELSADVTGGMLRLRWFDTRLLAEDLGRIIYDALKAQFILSVVSVNIIFDPLRIGSLKPSILAYREERDQMLKKRSEDAAPFIVCRSCHSYAPHAFCISTADRPPCCGRPYDELATLAQLTRGMEQLTVDKGICMDRQRGSYLGADKIARMSTDESVLRVNLHSLRDNPHPTTAIPECITYYMEELDIFCILSRDYAGRGPDGKTYDSLLVRIAGRQAPGYAGVSEAYILSARFFAHEGGLSRVGWMNSALKTRLGLRVEHIATEKDCINLAGLKEFRVAWRH
jgi:hypothetical protein